MTTSNKQTSLFTEDNATSSQEACHANHQASQESEKVRQMIVGSGRRLSEQLGRLNLDLSFLRILLESSRWKTASHLRGYSWRNWPTVTPFCFGDAELSTKLDGITFPKWRKESIKAAGNAVVPQVVHQIFKAIEQYNLQD